jgi:spermidine/putrescine transport system ATP-binding protein
MYNGHILQVGSPREIYDRPAERFVANFIGETNFLEGQFVSASKGQAKVALDLGVTVVAGLVEGLSPSGKVTVVVRPEHAKIAVGKKNATLTGTLENIVYFGTDTHFHVKLSKGGEFVVREQNNKTGPSAMSVGAPVGVMFEAGAAQVLKD